ncbi:hypothetical protein DOTSEDRAFT_70725 [Dothistroma septosporum NZE10]|uniref:Uncharacterized protein n=1 Tax=Dothistroma septosporum (strain NZE10 / CBS 128990) TaxID=675120 RepID=N1PWR9_DOTSN|nr:hypothetical protein DOTSEDRAFT_70725 [Dothistroma septosporum NZE10]
MSSSMLSRVLPVLRPKLRSPAGQCAPSQGRNQGDFVHTADQRDACRRVPSWIIDRSAWSL